MPIIKTVISETQSAISILYHNNAATLTSWHQCSVVKKIATMISSLLLGLVVSIHVYSCCACCAYGEPVKIPLAVINGSTGTCPEQSRVESGINFVGDEVRLAVENLLPYFDHRYYALMIISVLRPACRNRADRTERRPD